MLNKIKGKPPQTYLNPYRKWIFGQHSTIYYYQFFDSEKNQFGDLSAFQFNPQNFQLVNRIYADRAHWEDRLNRWVCEQGWQRSFQNAAIQDYHQFDVSTFNTVSEPPPYFKKEVRQSLEMNYEQLRRYIHDLQQSGFEVVRLKVQLQKKLAFPVITFVMGVLARTRPVPRRRRRRAREPSGPASTAASATSPCRRCCRCSRDSRAWRSRRRGHSNRNCGGLLRSLRTLRSDGKHQPATASPGGVVARCNLRAGRRLFDFESAHLKNQDAALDCEVALRNSRLPICG